MFGKLESLTKIQEVFSIFRARTENEFIGEPSHTAGVNVN